jgi:hypothetical protein
VLSLGQELALEVEREILVDPAEYQHEMHFEGLYSLLGYVLPVIIGGNELITHFVFLDRCFELSRAFVVKDVVFGMNTSFVEAVDHMLVSMDHLAGGAILHGFDKDATAVDVHEHHYILVSSA